MFNQLDVVPAYGRDYISKNQLLADWNAGKDFRALHLGCYLSKDSVTALVKDGYNEINFRYSKQRKKLVINLVTGE
jgi:hypothetical protein